jgi:hypothetical protein
MGVADSPSLRRCESSTPSSSGTARPGPHYAWLLPQVLARTLPAARVDRAVDPAWRAIPAGKYRFAMRKPARRLPARTELAHLRVGRNAGRADSEAR